MSKQEKLLAEKTVGLKPSGIRRFFDLVSEMKDAISLGVGEPDFDTPWHIRDNRTLIRRGTSGMRAFTRWRRAALSTPPTPDLRSSGRRSRRI